MDKILSCLAKCHDLGLDYAIIAIISILLLISFILSIAYNDAK
jgi:hypothetical protein